LKHLPGFPGIPKENPVKPPVSSPPPAASAAEIRRRREGALAWTEVDTGAVRFFHLTGTDRNTAPDAPAPLDSGACGQLGDFMRSRDARPLFHDEFRDAALLPDWCAALDAAGLAPDWPVTWLDGHDARPGHSEGFQVDAVAGPGVETIEHRGRVVGRRFEDDEAEWLALGDLRPENRERPRTGQTADVLETMLAILEENGMGFGQVVRTWFYLDHILEWYDDFNLVRNDFFEKHGIYDMLVPASTGIGCAHPAGTAMVAKLLAVRPKSGGRVAAVDSPLQCPATDYRSSFSRAVEVALPSHRKLYISGTASIEPGGLTAHAGDTAAQIELTMDVVEAILESRGLGWADTTRAVAYLRNDRDRPLLAGWLSRRGLDTLPLLVVQSDVCRDDLLYEIELDAVSRAAPPR
jgi:enamine deaminase RidA (YjgF/YER057c/UK114 family)